MKFNVVVVDDERPAIDEIEEALAASGMVAGISSFSHSGEALQAIMDNRPDIVFVDIQMPGMNGLQMAESLMRTAPECEVVFVTAYEQHALAAFRLAAVDYLLKPVEPERLAQTLHRIRRRRRSQWPQSEHKPEICCFGSLRVTGEFGKIKWRTAKVGELFAYLYMHREVSVERLIDDLFPDFEAEKSRVYLHTAVYQLRKSLAAAGLSDRLKVRYDKNVYELEVNRIFSDLQQFDALAAKPEPGPDALRQAVSLYSGDLLEGITGLWVLERRENSRRHFIRMAGRLLGICEASGELRQALELVQKLHRYDPLSESLALEVARFYLLLNQHRLAEDYIERYLNRYREEMGAEASSAMESYRIMKDKLTI